jgi:hypothetical protein
MVSKDKSSKQTDADILRCKADVLRARDVTLSYAETNRKPLDSQYTGRNTNHSDASAESLTANPAKVREDVAPIPIEATKPPVVTTINHKPAVTGQHDKAEIPKFDLAEDIMAEQRRITAIKRKSPAKRIEAVSLPPAVGSAGLQQWPKPQAQEQIIAEIVARDIEKLCRGDIPATSY